MSKIELDKYYTPDDLAKYCVEKTKEIIGEDNITEYLEPSAGVGVFLKYLDKPYLAYDIEPEGENIVQADYLTLNLAQKFYKKSVKLGDYIAFILPISQLNNSFTMYEFDLIHSEDLGKKEYSGAKLHCCFNIYKRPQKGLNKYKIKKLKDITVYRDDTKGYLEKDFDIRICYRGYSAGKILKEHEHYRNEYKIKIHNNELRNEIIRVLNEVDWKKELKCISTPAIMQFHIYELLEREIPEIK